MKKLLLFSFTVFSFVLSAQNLVPNPNFELYNTCPYGQSQISFATGWMNAGSSPDYFNTCATWQDFSVPNNYGGYQMPATGSAYAAIGVYGDSTFGYSCNSGYCDARELIGRYLSTPLLIGTKYFVSLKANLSISNPIYVNCAIDKLGVLFTTTERQLDFSNPNLIGNFAHIYSTSLITDTLGWTTINGSFIADSAYQYIMIGNFFDNAHTNKLIMDTNSFCNSYYFIDDICVSSDSTTCKTITSTTEFQIKKSELKLYPNPGIEYFNISTGSHLQSEMIIYDANGNEIEKHLFTNNYKINTNKWLQGIYFIQIKINNTFQYEKLVILNH